MSPQDAPQAGVGGQPEDGDSTPLPGKVVITACGGRINYAADTSWALFRSERVYFCLPICKTDYEDDPSTSCLAFRLLDSSSK